MVSYSKFLKVLLSFSIALSPVMFINSANASTLAGGSGWRVASTVSNGIGVTVNGVKDIIVNGSSKTVTGIANVTPTAGQVGKFLGKNAGAAAVIGAMDLLLDGVDWVMDPANNSVTYPPKDNSTYAQPYHKNRYTCQLAGFSACTGNKSFASMSAIGSAMAASDYTTITSCNMVSPTDGECIGKQGRSYTFFMSPNPTYDQSKEEERKVTVPLSNIGEQVINQAETEVKSGNPAQAAAVTQAAAAAVVGEAAKDEPQARPIVAELDKSAAIPTDQTAVGEIAPPTTNPDTGEVKPGSISLDFPVFCSWAPSMCVLADKVQEAITDAREWVKESEETDTELEFPEQEQQETDTNITFNASCPAKITLVNFNYHGNQQNWEVDFTEWCSAVTTYIRPIVISMGAFSAVLIVSGVRINE